MRSWGNFSTSCGLDSARRRFELYICTMTALKLNPFDPSEWELAALIVDQSAKSKSGPRRMLQALSWAEKAFGISLV